MAQIDFSENPIIIGCNYHTTWQRDPRMRFVLAEVKGSRAKCITRKTKNAFWTDVKDLIFIQTPYNKWKAEKLSAQ